MASGADMLGVVPQGMHQHRMQPVEESSLVLTAWRELFEELFGGKEVEEGDPHLAPDWFLSESSPLRWFDTNDGFELYCTGVASDTLAGTYDVSFLLIVHDPTFLSLHRAALRTNWEFPTDHLRSPFVTSLDAKNLRELLTARDWAGSSLYSFARGLSVLRSRFPDRVAAIDLQA